MIETDFGERFIKTNDVIIFQLTFTLYFCQITVHFFTFLCSPYLSFEHMQVEKSLIVKGLVAVATHIIKLITELAFQIQSQGSNLHLGQ